MAKIDCADFKTTTKTREKEEKRRKKIEKRHRILPYSLIRQGSVGFGHRHAPETVVERFARMRQ